MSNFSSGLPRNSGPLGEEKNSSLADTHAIVQVSLTDNHERK